MRDDSRTNKWAIGELAVHALTPEQSLIMTPRGKRYVVQVGADDLRSWHARHSVPHAPGELTDGMPEGFASVVEALRKDGVLQPVGGVPEAVWLRAPHPSLSVDRLRRTTVVVVGDEPLRSGIAGVLRAGEYAGVEVADLAELAALAGRTDLLVVAGAVQPAGKKLREVEEFCQAQRLPWIPVRWQEGRIFAGPGMIPGVTATFEDLVKRRLTAARDERIHHSVWDEPGLPPVMTAAEAGWAYNVLGTQIERWLAGAYRADIAGSEIELDVIENLVNHHFILPVPGTPGRVPPSPADIWKLTDAQTGVVTTIRRVSGRFGLPPTLHVVGVDVADMRRVAAWPNDRQAFGTSWESSDAAQTSATGEAVERYCGNYIEPGRNTVTGSFNELRRQGLRALDPAEIALYSETQYRTRGFPFVPFTRDSEVTWVEGRSLTRQEIVWVPAFMVYVMWHERQGLQEARHSYPVLAGIAAGPSREYAEMSALEEVIERDATMIWWSTKQRLPKLSLPPRAAALISSVAHRYEVSLIHLENDFAVPVMAAALRDRDKGHLGIGFAARENCVVAAEKALAEAFTLQMSCQSLDDRSSRDHWQSTGLQSMRNIKPWRADRYYLDDYRADFHDVVDLICQQQIYLDPRAGDAVRDRVFDLPERDWDGLPLMPARSLELLRAAVERENREVISVDVTTSDVASVGFSVVRVLVPGLVSNFPAAFPLWGLDRVRRAPVRLGWQPVPLDESELSTFPLPHV
ncbi:MAG TPA: YcaO-like family protein [Actinoplanes sp.]|nr:YcaO-like family protein [Actinoplanes sp.]